MRIWNQWSVGPSILMYHSISDSSNEQFTVTKKDFHEQIVWLVSNGYEIIPLESMLLMLQAHDCTNLGKKVVITFDDGYKDFVVNALPILQDFGVAATVFLVTGMLAGVAKWNRYGSEVRLMTKDDACYIKERGISLGSHTSTHLNLLLLSDEEIEKQLNDSRETLIELGESFYSFSYPWGQWSSGLAGAVRAAGYKCALAVGEQTRLIAEDCYYLPRVTMSRDMSSKKFQRLLCRTGFETELRRKYRAIREAIVSSE